MASENEIKDVDFEVVDDIEELEEVQASSYDSVDILPDVDEMKSIEELEEVVDSVSEYIIHDEDEAVNLENLRGDVELKPIDVNEIKEEVKEEVYTELKDIAAKGLLIGVPMLALFGLMTSWIFISVASVIGAALYYKLKDKYTLFYYVIGLLFIMSMFELITLAYNIGRLSSFYN